MTKLKLLSAAFIATAMVATPALARENRAAVRHHTTATTVDRAACIRAPDVGAGHAVPGSEVDRTWALLPAIRGPFRLANPRRSTDRSASREVGPEEQFVGPTSFVAFVSGRRLNQA